MLIVIVDVQVLPTCVAAFTAATLENAAKSRQEPGVARFDFLATSGDPTRFALIEVFRSEGAAAEHKQTAHYQRWRQAVEPFMARPRQSVTYTNVSPSDGDW